MQDGRSNPELYDSDGKGLVAALALGPIRVIKSKYALNLQKTLDHSLFLSLLCAQFPTILSVFPQL